jgi:hypothetical protein
VRAENGIGKNLKVSSRTEDRKPTQDVLRSRMCMVEERLRMRLRGGSRRRTYAHVRALPGLAALPSPVSPRKVVGRLVRAIDGLEEKIKGIQAADRRSRFASGKKGRAGHD